MADFLDAQLQKFASSGGFSIILDEVYIGITPPNAHHSLLSCASPRLRNAIFLVLSASKGFALASLPMRKQDLAALQVSAQCLVHAQASSRAVTRSTSITWSKCSQRAPPTPARSAKKVDTTRFLSDHSACRAPRRPGCFAAIRHVRRLCARASLRSLSRAHRSGSQAPERSACSELEPIFAIGLFAVDC